MSSPGVNTTVQPRLQFGTLYVILARKSGLLKCYGLGFIETNCRIERIIDCLYFVGGTDMETNYSKHAAVWDWDGYNRSEEFNFWCKMSSKYGKNVLSAMGALGEAGAYMTKKGYRVTVIDYTKEMIDEGRKRYGDLEFISFLCADICKFDLDKKDYDFCFIGSGDLHLLADETDIKMALKNINTHLRLGGGLGLELWTASDSSWTAPRRKFEPRVPKTDGPRIWKIGGATYDSTTKRNSISQTVYIDDNGIIETFEYSVCLQLYDRHILLNAIYESGFEVVGEYCDYNFEKWNCESNTWIIELKKVGNIIK
jgi:hypothetical protein